MTKLAVKIRLKQNGGKLVTLVGNYYYIIIKFVTDLALDLSETCDVHFVEQVTVCRPVATKDRAQPHFSPCGLCGGQSWNSEVFLSEYFGLSLSALFRHCSVIKRLSPMLYKLGNLQRLQITNKQTTNSVALVRTRTIPTERPPPVGEVSANFCG